MSSRRSLPEVERIGKAELVEASRAAGAGRWVALERPGAWVGLGTVEPGAPRRWHRHPGQEMLLYIVEGTLRLEFGPLGHGTLQGRPGDFVRIAPGALHRETALGKGVAKFVLLRLGKGPPAIEYVVPPPRG
ncbi:MAG: cupin domain-containing protein [Euryarchaeota archaeon]|nr:cupin domain-containing protein [Euryarchaeota archaeon]MDE1835345.1 cupin domain-containing protein [Euryarchaeota archaeon]MDE1880760.1 cupin domain-containing protein [Euryarchaeota archaeon]MDE2043641.1 cupin domain-containing protein [Thermoplasmata archaeon]